MSETLKISRIEGSIAYLERDLLSVLDWQQGGKFAVHSPRQGQSPAQRGGKVPRTLRSTASQRDVDQQVLP